jgi:AraC-like DNA-binding protein
MSAVSYRSPLISAGAESVASNFRATWARAQRSLAISKCYSVDMLLARPPCSPALAPFVASLWVHRAQLAHRFERVLPSGRMQLLVNLHEDELRDYTLDGRAANRSRGAGLQGPRTAPVVVDTIEQHEICGVNFTPAGAWPFLGVPASEVTERVIDLSEFWGRDGSVLRQRILEARDPAAQLDVLETALLEHARYSNARDREVEIACALVAEGVRIRTVGDQIGLTPRQLIARFRSRIGMSPKLFARIARFQRVIHAIDGEIPWIELAGRYGFADQAHLIREFRVFAGTTPTAYRARSVEDRNHIPIDSRQFSSIHGA